MRSFLLTLGEVVTKYATIASDPLVKRWLANLRRGSRTTASVAERRFGKTLEFLNELLEAKKQGKLRRQRVGADKMTPSRLLRDAKRNPKRFQDLLEDLVAERELKGNAPGYISGLLKSIRSMLRYHDVVLNRRIKISNANSTLTIEYEQIPSQEELSRIFRASPSRTRVAEVLMAFADLRPEPMGNIDGTDGLMLKDLPELKVRANEVVFENVPTMIIVRSALSKAGHKYFTFLSSEGCTYLKEYLDGRLRKGENLVPEGPIIGHERPGASFKPFLCTTNISDDVRECMREAGVRKRPYVLRAYAETQLIIAESRGKISHPFLQFIAGHKGDIEARYSTNKGRLPPDMIEDMREAYKRCEPFLSTVAQPLEQASVVKEAKLEAIKTIAKNLLGMDLVEVKIAHEKDLGRELSKDEEIEFYEREMFEEKRKHADNLMDRLFEDPEVIALVRRKLTEIQNESKH